MAASSPEQATPPDAVHAQLRRYWDEDAATYDRSLSHGLTESGAAAAWRALLARLLPPAPARVLDVGAGTGAMSLLVAELGHSVTAVDLSPGMLAHAARKATERGLSVATVVGRADEPPAGPFDAVIERHLLWTLPDPAATLARWHDVAAPTGRLILLEGFWGRNELPFRLLRGLGALARRAMGHPHDHHGGYEPELVAALPMAGGTRPDGLLAVAADAGWRRLRIERMRDVEWAYRLARGPVLGLLDAVPLFVVVGEA